MTNNDIQPKPYLFVYGTLRQGFSNPMARLMQQQCSLIGSGSMDGSLYDVGQYPAACLGGRPGALIKGEIYDLPDNFNPLIKQLDKYEDCDTTYERLLLEIEGEDGQVYHSWAYIYCLPTQNLKQIVSGDYIRYIENQSEERLTLIPKL
ncbi:MAG: gamma-glutamylcyclotransferase family protein [Chitinophagales bacterium]